MALSLDRDMKMSDIVAHLNALIAKHGDLGVQCYDEVESLVRGEPDFEVAPALGRHLAEVPGLKVLRIII